MVNKVLVTLPPHPAVFLLHLIAHTQKIEWRLEASLQGQSFLALMGWCYHVNILSLTLSLLPVAFVN